MVRNGNPGRVFGTGVGATSSGRLPARDSRYRVPLRPASAVLFDWDGTLANSFPVIRRASLAVFRHFGIRMDDVRYRATYRPDWQETYRQLGIPEHRWDEAGEIFLARYRERSAEVALYPGVEETLTELAGSGVRLGVVTSANRDRFLGDLEHAGLVGRFEVLVAFEDSRRKKPHPESLLLALDRLGVAPEGALYAGDRPEDVAMGRRAGAGTAAVVSDFSDEEMLRAAKPDVLLPGIRHLPQVLRDGAGP